MSRSNLPNSAETKISRLNLKTASHYFITTALLLLPFSLFSDTLSISGNPGTLTISTATAGSNPNSASDSSTTYNLSTTTGSTRTITGKISSNMPTGVTLKVQLAAPSGATSAGSKAMSTAAVNLVTSIPINASANNLSITYTFSATAAAAPVASATRTLTLTMQ
jgi:hypothetical protein